MLDKAIIHVKFSDLLTMQIFNRFDTPITVYWWSRRILSVSAALLLNTSHIAKSLLFTLLSFLFPNPSWSPTTYKSTIYINNVKWKEIKRRSSILAKGFCKWQRIHTSCSEKDNSIEKWLNEIKGWKNKYEKSEYPINTQCA